jgi:hypothetical protein
VASREFTGSASTPSVPAHGRPQRDDLVLGEEGGVTQGLVDIAGLAIRIGFEDRFARFAGRHKSEQAHHWKPEPANAGLADADRRIDSDGRERHLWQDMLRPA